MKLFTPLLLVCASMLHTTATTVFAQQRNQLSVAGLQRPVEVLRDNWGVNHIYAANQHDLFFAQGYCAAKDRLFQFEIWRRQATGTLAAILGVRELQRDIGARLFRFRGNMDKELNHYHPQGKQIILAFTDGINAYIDEVNRHPQQLPIEFRLLHIVPGKWTPDVVISRHQGILGNITEELNMGRAVSMVGDRKIKDLLWFHPDEPLLQMDSAINTVSLGQDILAMYNAWRKDIVFMPEDSSMNTVRNATAYISHGNTDSYGQYTPSPPEMEGSNNWVVASSRTASGHTMLANDPHRKIALPSLRYIVHLNAPGWNVTGGGEPEIPGVAIGHNQDGAWGITVHQTDAEDLYVYDLRPGHLDQYRYKGNWVQMKALRETINVKGTAPVTVMLRFSLHGPILYIDSIHHKAYALRAGWLQTGAAPYLASLRMDQASNWTSFREACSYARLPALNMVWADKKGSIGWQTVGLIPIRKNFSGLVPVPGDGRYEWAGSLPIKQRPHLSNPARGFFASANEDLIPNNFKYHDAMGFTWPDAYRANRINQVLAADNRMDIQKMMALQTDYFSIPAQQLVPLIQHIEISGSLAQAAKAALLQWNFVMEKTAVGAGIYNKWEREMMQEAAQQFVPASIKGLITLQTTKLIEWLQHPDAKFGADPVKGRDSFLVKTLQQTVHTLQLQLGAEVSKWQFGQNNYKHISFIHPLNDLLSPDWKEKLNTISIARGGYGHTVNATGNQDNQGNGASFRYITDTGNWDATLMTNTPGQSGNPTSRWYKNLFTAWAGDDYFPNYFSKEKIQLSTAEKMLLVPRR